jgi:hypothetical protein
MQPLPASDLRSNIGTWAVPTDRLPALGSWLHDVLPVEPYDPHFRGQKLETTYFDSPGFDLRKARLGKDRYLTLRLRCYEPEGGDEFYALSAKTESQKFRKELPAADAERYLQSGNEPGLLAELPADLQARALELTGDRGLVAVALVRCRRYAVEDGGDRYTLDVGVRADTGKRLPFHVLEYKSTDPRARPPARLGRFGLRPVKLSKFLWATQP